MLRHQMQRWRWRARWLLHGSPSQLTHRQPSVGGCAQSLAHVRWMASPASSSSSTCDRNRVDVQTPATPPVVERFNESTGGLSNTASTPRKDQIDAVDHALDQILTMNAVEGRSVSKARSVSTEQVETRQGHVISTLAEPHPGGKHEKPRHQQPPHFRPQTEQDTANFLRSKPTIRLVEAFVERLACNKTGALAPSTYRQLARYYLDPGHHEQGRSFCDIVSSFERFLRRHGDLLCGENKSVELQMVSATSLVDAKYRREYSYVVIDYATSDENADPDMMLTLARSRLEEKSRLNCKLAPGDTRWFREAMLANLRREDDKERGLANTLELFRLMQEKWAVAFPRKLWPHVVLRMIETQKPIPAICEWMASNLPTTKNIEPMSLLLDELLTTMKRPDIALELLEPYLQRFDGSDSSWKQQLLVHFHLENFLLATPTLRQVDDYLSLMGSGYLNRSQLDQLLDFCLDPLHHKPGASSRAIAAACFRLLGNNLDRISWRSFRAYPEEVIESAMPPVKPWYVVLLVLGSRQRSLSELLQWLDSYQMYDVTDEMMRVVWDERYARFMKHPNVTLAMLVHALKYSFTSKTQKTRDVVVRSLLVKFLFSKPSVDDLKFLLKHLASAPATTMKHAGPKIVSHVVKSANAANCTPIEAAKTLLELVKEFNQVLVLSVDRNCAKLVGRLVGQCADDCVLLSKEFLTLSESTDRYRFDFVKGVLQELVKARVDDDSAVEHLRGFLGLVKSLEIDVNLRCLETIDPAVKEQLSKELAALTADQRERESLNAQAVIATWNRILAKH